MNVKSSLLPLLAGTLTLTSGSPVLIRQNEVVNGQLHANTQEFTTNYSRLSKRNFAAATGLAALSETAKIVGRKLFLKLGPKALSKAPQSVQNMGHKTLSTTALNPLVMAGRSPLQKATDGATMLAVGAASSVATGVATEKVKKHFKNKEKEEKDNENEEDDEDTEEGPKRSRKSKKDAEDDDDADDEDDNEENNENENEEEDRKRSRKRDEDDDDDDEYEDRSRKEGDEDDEEVDEEDNDREINRKYKSKEPKYADDYGDEEDIDSPSKDDRYNDGKPTTKKSFWRSFWPKSKSNKQERINEEIDENEDAETETHSHRRRNRDYSHENDRPSKKHRQEYDDE